MVWSDVEWRDQIPTASLSSKAWPFKTRISRHCLGRRARGAQEESDVQGCPCDSSLVLLPGTGDSDANFKRRNGAFPKVGRRPPSRLIILPGRSKSCTDSGTYYCLHGSHTESSRGQGDGAGKRDLKDDAGAQAELAQKIMTGSGSQASTPAQQAVMASRQKLLESLRRLLGDSLIRRTNESKTNTGRQLFNLEEPLFFQVYVPLSETEQNLVQEMKARLTEKMSSSDLLSLPTRSFYIEYRMMNHHVGFAHGDTPEHFSSEEDFWENG